MGMKDIPGKWAMLRNLPIDNMSISEIYPESISWDDILRVTTDVGKKNVVHNGGHIKDGVLFIPHQTLTLRELEQAE